MAPKPAAPPPRKQSVTLGGESQRGKGKKAGKKQQKMHFTVPEGVQPGELLKLMTPRGGQVEVEVPADAKVGKSFAVTVPASSSAPEEKREAARISVKVPPGAMPGQVIKGKTPAGREFDVAVPAGVKPGKSFLVMVPLEDDDKIEAEAVTETPAEAAPAPAVAPLTSEKAELAELNDLFATGPPSQRHNMPAAPAAAPAAQPAAEEKVEAPAEPKPPAAGAPVVEPEAAPEPPAPEPEAAAAAPPPELAAEPEAPAPAAAEA